MTYQPKNLPPCTAELIESGAACVVQDGSGIRVPMTMQDAAPTCGCRAADADSERAQADERRIAAAQAQHDRVQAYADHYRRVDEQREAAARSTPAGAAYADACADLDYRTRRNVA